LHHFSSQLLYKYSTSGNALDIAVIYDVVEQTSPFELKRNT
jgi:hypothetical protein